jgi:hypothetical protein
VAVDAGGCTRGDHEDQRRDPRPVQPSGVVAPGTQADLVLQNDNSLDDPTPSTPYSSSEPDVM